MRVRRSTLPGQSLLISFSGWLLARRPGHGYAVLMRLEKVSDASAQSYPSSMETRFCGGGRDSKGLGYFFLRISPEIAQDENGAKSWA